MAWIAYLLLQAADGEALLKGLQEKIAGAPGLRLEFRVEQEKKGPGEVRGELKLKGADKWALQLTMARDRTGSVVFDGRRAVAGGITAGDPPPEPEKVAAAIRSRLAALPVFVAFDDVMSGSRGRSRKPPTPADVKEEARETADGRELRVLRYILKSEEGPARFNGSVKLFLDARTLLPVRRESSFSGMTIAETYAVFDLADLPDADFVYATPARLAAARTAQAARSVELFTRYTGRHPASLADLVERPKDLPADAFWPEGGFALGGAVPADPAGKSYALAFKDGMLHVGDVPVADATGRAIGAPTERLRAHFTLRVRLHLLASVVRAWFETYGGVDENLAIPPGSGLPWPEGGWLPGGLVTSPFVLAKAGPLLRVHAVGSGRIAPTPEEIAALDAAAAPRLSEDREAAARRACDALGADDLDARLESEARLRRMGEAVVVLLESRLKEEKDVEAAGRLRALLRSIPRTPAPWRRETGSLTAYVGSSGTIPANERNASATLKTIASAEADFRANDRDGNQVQDFWTGDVAGLYALKNGDGEAVKLIEPSLMAADAAPLPKGAAGGRHAGIESFGVPAPKAGYFFQAMTFDRSATPPEAYQRDTEGNVAMGKVHNHSRFGYCAFPAEYGATGTRTFILSEGNTVFYRDSQGEPVLDWPSDDELRRDWRKLD